jgi:hypothetical protein
MRTALLILVSLAVILLAVLTITYRAVGTKPLITAIQDRHQQSLEQFIRTHEPSLTNHAELILAGKIEKQKTTVSYPPPSLTNISERVLSVSADANSNIYFITTDSFTTFNVGFIYQREGKPFLGDGQEPTMVTNIYLFNNWYYYKSR